MTGGPELTLRGATTRARIVAAAVELMYVRGVNGTTLDDVRAASGTSKSQLYRHFPDKQALVQAVVAARAEQILDREQARLQGLDSFDGLRRWREALVQANDAQHGSYGCALGSLAIEVADSDEPARSALASAFQSWEQLLADGLRRMQAAGSLVADADPDALATGLMAALQGGYLLAQAAHDVAPMRIALDMALAQIKSQLT